MSNQQESQVLNERNSERKSNSFFEISTTTFQNVIGYACMDIVYAISLHYIAAHNNPQAVAGLGLATTTGKTILAPMGMAMNQSLNMHSSTAVQADIRKLAQTFFTMTLVIHIISFFLLASINKNNLATIVLLSPLIALTIDDENRQATSEGAGLYIYYLLTSSLLNMIYEGLKSFMNSYQVQKLHLFLKDFENLCTLFGVIYSLTSQIMEEVFLVLDQQLYVLNFQIVYFVQLLFQHLIQKHSFQRLQVQIFNSKRWQNTIIAFIYADSFAFYIRNFIALSFGSAYFNAQLALTNTSSFYFRFSISLSITIMKFIDREMSNKQLKKAQSYTKVGILIYFCFAIAFIIILILLNKGWANFYTVGDEEIADILFQVFPIFLIGLIIDGLQGTLTGVLKGVEKKQFFTYTALVVNYFIGVPLVFYLSCDLYGFGVSKKIYGIWSAFAVTHLILSILFLCSTLMTNWQEVNEKILKSKRVQLLSIKQYDDEPWDMRDMIEDYIR